MTTARLISTPARMFAGFAAAIATVFSLGTTLVLAEHYANTANQDAGLAQVVHQTPASRLV